MPLGSGRTPLSPLISLPPPGTAPPGGDAPPPALDPGTYLDTANLALQISVGVVTVLTLFLALLAFLGLREMATIRRRQRELSRALAAAQETRDEIEGKLKSLHVDLEALVMTAHLFHEGQVAYAKADYDRAISSYQQALELQPDNPRIQVRFARALVNKGFNSRAERVLRAATTRDPLNADAWRALSTCRRYVNLTEAIDFAERAVDLDPKSSDNWNYLGLLLRDSERYEDALSAFGEATRVAPREPFGKFYQALILTKLQDDRAAIPVLRDAHADAETLRSARRIKEIWCMTIEWTYRRSLDTPEQEDAANKIVALLAVACHEARDRQAVLGHMTFYLAAKGIDLDAEASLQAFPEADVVSARKRVLREGN
ncbi:MULTISPECIES: tetratricopeptide repeat protein [Micromonospora]|uniref:TPR repeat-containing protein n=1 Tax=Micromonospora yangpuensis TaxID=683228 RepID=A0A1C6U0Y4_9ACTN|nr:tetratricopeptide repeat protein [Micromonospora yangpuensis]GGM11690.1 hypothetical protein GCM10012279_32250 [Micromonospora yangpuensis]SCL47558.1 TPR repeat-containing protein [Micromonospora yangpuensis]